MGNWFFFIFITLLLQLDFLKKFILNFEMIRNRRICKYPALDGSIYTQEEIINNNFLFIIVAKLIVKIIWFFTLHSQKLFNAIVISVSHLQPVNDGWKESCYQIGSKEIVIKFLHMAWHAPNKLFVTSWTVTRILYNNLFNCWKETSCYRILLYNNLFNYWKIMVTLELIYSGVWISATHIKW